MLATCGEFTCDCANPADAGGITLPARCILVQSVPIRNVRDLLTATLTVSSKSFTAIAESEEKEKFLGVDNFCAVSSLDLTRSDRNQLLR